VVLLALEEQTARIYKHSMKKPPVNFLFIITDQHRADYLGCTGHPVLKTPAIDSLAVGGALLKNLHTASPVCMPNRSSLLTGRYPSVHGLRRNGLFLPYRASTFVDVLRTAGYDTAIFGKSHIRPMTGQPPDIAPPTVNADIPEAWKSDGEDYEEEAPERWRSSEPFSIRLPHYGFSVADITTLHSDQCGGHYYQWLRRQTPDADQLRALDNRLEHDYICPQAERTQVPEEWYPTAYIRDRAVDYLKAPARANNPFFTFVSFPDPHHPFTPPGKYWDMYSPDDMPPPLPFEAHQNPPPHLLAQHNMKTDGKQKTGGTAVFAAEEREIREAAALTCGMIAMIDDAVGALLSALDETGLRENTVVVFTSDHGDYLGDFGLMLKGPALMRGVTNTPFIWNDPAENFGGKMHDELFSTVDIAPTILARAGAMQYNGMQGMDIFSVLRGDCPPREDMLVEFEDSNLKMGFAEPAFARALLTNEYRLTLYAGYEWGELYNLREDPRETRNLWDDPAYAKTRAELVERLARRMMATAETSPFPARRA